ncbi:MULTISPECIES: hypothetical protein [Aphanothece]|uniref:hypothetical protein n=1 Tax=Aphanothece TaxID=1121 RepID=UPI00398EFA4F
MTSTTTTSTTLQTQTSPATFGPAVVDFATALGDPSAGRSAAALTEALLPQVSEAFWLRVSSNALLETTENEVLSMVLERALPRGVSIALDVDWSPERWGLPVGAAPTAEVKRRLRPLAQAAQLIRCDADEAEAFFASTDPALIQERLAQRPAVLVQDRRGGLLWSVGGRRGWMEPALLDDHDAFLANLLVRLGSQPQLLGTAGAGIEAIADPDALAEQLLAAAAADSPLAQGPPSAASARQGHPGSAREGLCDESRRTSFAPESMPTHVHPTPSQGGCPWTSRSWPRTSPSPST